MRAFSHSVWPDALVGDGEGEVGTRLTGVRRGEWDGETESHRE